MSLKDIFDLESELADLGAATTATVATMQAGKASPTATDLLLPATKSQPCHNLVAASSSAVATQEPSPEVLVAEVAIVAADRFRNRLVKPIELTHHVSSPTDLQHWITLVKEASTPEAVLAIVAKFKQLPWTDDQCARMSKTYITRLEILHPPQAIPREPFCHRMEEM